MATIRDVSKLAGVSVATVSRVLNRSGYVGAATEAKVTAAMEALSYKPSETARSLAGKQSSMIALMVPDLLNPFFPELALAIETCASAYGYTVILCNSNNDAEKERKLFDLLVHKRVDGLILSSYTATPKQIIALQDRGIPVVVVDNGFPGQPILSLIARNREGAREAVRHLLKQGCSKIGHLSGPADVTAARDRRQGYADECAALPWFSSSLIEQGDFQAEGGYDAAKRLLDREPGIDGIFAGNDAMAIGALKLLHERGSRVPDDMRVIGFDGIRVPMVVPELSTMVQPIYEMGEQAMQQLHRLIGGEDVKRETIELNTSLLVRRSSSR
ncbi:LacI family transcriptional regulator [Paenibacillus rhizovicinus]|uniref:LacI family transcriptional regulator n=1 Tax=Paenibacillus rhizovicinus TaxID=2704463 RepID=A0A6C0P6Z9_9BACL|nr:LacI family DNA-binding transcriptional regulator [Paenibacillus rhizovicinus]QHW34298.1 LacI family transcriptional regulator [Paenibacillus rhizovicinus]